MKKNCLLLLGFLLLPGRFAAAGDGDPAAGGFSGRVLETTNTAGYTYVQVDAGGRKLWAATTEFPVKVGDQVVVGAGAAMSGYHSQSLNRTFDLVYFTGRISVNGNGAGSAPGLPPGHPPLPGANLTLPPGHPALNSSTTTSRFDFSRLKRADGGRTIAEIYAGQNQLAGKSVSVRGKVVKYNGMIMGVNWLHIRDGSGDAGNHDDDLIVTTATLAALGATVLVTGMVSTNRDFGAGYKYRVMIEDAQVTVE